MANQYKNAKADLTDTSDTTLYTCPAAKTAIVKSILVSADTVVAGAITVKVTDASSNVFSLFSAEAVTANSTLELLTAPLVIEESEVLKVQAATGNTLHIVASLLEVS